MKTSISDAIEFFESNGELRVKTREKATLEFKSVYNDRIFMSCLKTISGMANTEGGQIIFGISENPRKITGVSESTIPDEATVSDKLRKYLYPIPSFSIEEEEIHDKFLFSITIDSLSKPPTIFIKEFSNNLNGKANFTFRSGDIYVRNSAQTRILDANAASRIFEKRDNKIRQEILGLINRAQDIGFDKVGIIDFGQTQNNDLKANYLIPAEIASHLNIIDRGRLVEDAGAPAYEIQGKLGVATFSDRDPRKPLKPEAAARVLRETLRQQFFPELPFANMHLRRAATHLGFWKNPTGDGTNTSKDEFSGVIKYHEEGRNAVLDFAGENPDQFIDVIGSKDTKDKWALIKTKKL